MPINLEVIRVSADVAVGRYREVLIAQFRNATSASCVADLRKARDAMTPGEKFLFFAVVEPGSSPPDQEVRRAVLRFFEESVKTLSAVIVTYRGEGFRGAIVRTVLSSIFDLMPRSRFAFPRHIVGSLDEAATLARRHAPKTNSAALLDAYHELAGMSPQR